MALKKRTRDMLNSAKTHKSWPAKTRKAVANRMRASRSGANYIGGDKLYNMTKTAHFRH